MIMILYFEQFSTDLNSFKFSTFMMFLVKICWRIRALQALALLCASPWESQGRKENIHLNETILILETSKVQKINSGFISLITNLCIFLLLDLIDLRLQYLSGNLTDISVQYGIKELKNLFALDLSKSLVSVDYLIIHNLIILFMLLLQITDASLEMLAGAHMNLSVLYIRNCANISAKGIDTFRTKFPTCQVRI